MGRYKKPPEKDVPKKSTKKLTSVKQRKGAVTRKGYVEEENTNPNGREDFEELLKTLVKPQKK